MNQIEDYISTSLVTVGGGYLTCVYCGQNRFLTFAKTKQEIEIKCVNCGAIANVHWNRHTDKDVGSYLEDILERTRGPLTKEQKKKYGIPITKKLVYYEKKRNQYVKHDVHAVEVNEEHDGWATLVVHLDLYDSPKYGVAGLGSVLVHSTYFASMQDPHFVDNMEEMQRARNLETWVE